MISARHTFVVHVHASDGIVVSDVQSRDSAHLTGLDEVGSQISRWLEAKVTEDGAHDGDLPADGENRASTA